MSTRVGMANVANEKGNKQPTIKEVKKMLDEKGIGYDEKAKLKELMELLNGQPQDGAPTGQ